MNAMSTGKLKNILKRFKTKEELDHLHSIHSQLLSGGPQAAEREKVLRQMEALQTQKP